MTPKEYADKLVHQCRLILLQSDSELSHEINLTIYAKQFALVAVNEVLHLLPELAFWLRMYEYYQEVKKEIEKL